LGRGTTGDLSVSMDDHVCNNFFSLVDYSTLGLAGKCEKSNSASNSGRQTLILNPIGLPIYARVRDVLQDGDMMSCSFGLNPYLLSPSHPSLFVHRVENQVTEGVLIMSKDVLQEHLECPRLPAGCRLT
jgi:hypothetical protein